MQGKMDPPKPPLLTENGNLEVLTHDQAVTWKDILEREKALPKPNKKPSEELINQLKAIKLEKKSFLESLRPEQAQALRGNGNKPKNPPKQKKKIDNVDEAVLAALGDYSIKNEGSVIELVDIGINIQSRYKRDDIEKTLVRSGAAGVTRVILTGCSLKSSGEGIELCQAWYGADDSNAGKFPYNKYTSTKVRVYATVGVHPHDAKELANETKVFDDKLELVRKIASSPYCVSLGECGLDYDRMFSPMETQKRAFECQVALACELKKPLFVHLRERDADKGEPLGALEHALEIFAKFGCSLDPSKVCFHCFTGDLTTLKALSEKGFCIGFTGFVGMKKRGGHLIQALSDDSVIPLDRVMIETDTPFMKPDKHWFPDATCIKKSGNNEPAAMPAICRALASAYGMGKYSAHEVGVATTQNSMKFFGLDQVDENILGTGAAP